MFLNHFYKLSFAVETTSLNFPRVILNDKNEKDNLNSIIHLLQNFESAITCARLDSQPLHKSQYVQSISHHLAVDMVFGFDNIFDESICVNPEQIEVFLYLKDNMKYKAKHYFLNGTIFIPKNCLNVEMFDNIEIVLNDIERKKNHFVCFKLEDEGGVISHCEF